MAPHEVDYIVFSWNMFLIENVYFLSEKLELLFLPFNVEVRGREEYILNK